LDAVPPEVGHVINVMLVMDSLIHRLRNVDSATQTVPVAARLKELTNVMQVVNQDTQEMQTLTNAGLVMQIAIALAILTERASVTETVDQDSNLTPIPCSVFIQQQPDH
jgi:hypothetical protein